MKFGRDFHKHKVPMWEQHEAYVKYDRLKLLSRSATDEDFTKAVVEELKITKKVLAMQTESIQLQIDDLETRYGVSISSTAASPQSLLAATQLLTRVPIAELRDLRVSIEEIKTRIVELERYKMVNREAIKRAMDKRLRQKTRSTGQSSVSIASPSTITATQGWDSKLLSDVKSVEAVVSNALAAAYQGQYTSTSPTERTVSLLCQQWFRIDGAYIPDAAQLAIFEDDAVALRRVLQRYDDDDRDSADVKRLIKHLLELAVAYSSFECLDALVSAAFRTRQGLDDEMMEYAYIPHRLIIHLGRHHSSSPGIQDDMRIRRAIRALPTGSFQCDSLGNTPLHYAAKYGLSGICIEIYLEMERGAMLWDHRREMVLIHNDVGETALHVAVGCGHAQVVQILMDATMFDDWEGVPDPERDDDEQIFATRAGDLLLMAVRAGFLQVVSVLLSRRFGPKIVNHAHYNGQTALYLAAQYGHVQIVRKLLEAGAHRNFAEEVRGWTPLMVAVVQGHHEVAQVLMREATTNHNARDYGGWTALEHAVYERYH